MIQKNDAKPGQPVQASLLKRIKEHYPQIDNGTCAVCRIGYRNYINGKPGPCQNGNCLSHAIDAGISAPMRELGTPDEVFLLKELLNLACPYVPRTLITNDSEVTVYKRIREILATTDVEGAQPIKEKRP